MNRYIVVQTSRTAIFGAFSSTASDITADAVASLDKCVRDDMGGRLSLDTSFDMPDAVNGGALAVYRVPADFPAYVESEVGAHDVENGRTFGFFEDFELVGALVAEESDTTWTVVKSLIGSGPNPDVRRISVSRHDSYGAALAEAEELQEKADDDRRAEPTQAYHFSYDVEPA